ncbi:MAG: hypothetical protein HAW59_03670, partial [Betaproteobacteria bacterium]|nr:hypothetical protein [Betaproteobacteria bacterium]
PKPALFLARDAAAAAHLAEELSFFAPDIPARLLPDWENLPYEQLPPPPETQTRRMAALAAFWRGDGITIAAAATALFPFPPPEYIAARTFDLRIGQNIDSAALISRLAASGYARVDRVLAAGEFASYGGQIDIFPPDSELPFRLVLEDAEIEQIRLFSPATQMSVGKIGNLRLLPAGECDLSAAGAARFRRAFAEKFGGADAPELAQIAAGNAAGLEFMLPLFFDGAARLLDYAAAETLVLMHEECRGALARFSEQAARRQRHAEVYERRAALPAEELFLSPAALFESMQKFAVLELCGGGQKPPEVAVNRRRADSHAPLKDFLRTADGRVIIAADSEARRESLRAALAGAKLKPRAAASFAACGGKINLTVAPLRGGFAVKGLTVLTESEIFNVRLPPRRRRNNAPAAEDLSVGDAVAHRDYGVGRYAGAAEKIIGGRRGEFIKIEYAEGQILWLPAAHMHLLSPHFGASEPAKLGGKKWK